MGDETCTCGHGLSAHNQTGGNTPPHCLDMSCPCHFYRPAPAPRAAEGEKAGYVHVEGTPPNPPSTITVTPQVAVSGATGTAIYCADCQTLYEPANPATPTCKCPAADAPPEIERLIEEFERTAGEAHHYLADSTDWDAVAEAKQALRAAFSSIAADREDYQRIIRGLEEERDRFRIALGVILDLTGSELASDDPDAALEEIERTIPRLSTSTPSEPG